MMFCCSYFFFSAVAFGCVVIEEWMILNRVEWGRFQDGRCKKISRLFPFTSSLGWQRGIQMTSCNGVAWDKLKSLSREREREREREKKKKRERERCQLKRVAKKKLEWKIRIEKMKKKQDKKSRDNSVQ